MCRPIIEHAKKSVDSTEKINNIVICKCGSTDFKVFITTIIDDARLYCSSCGKERF